MSDTNPVNLYAGTDLFEAERLLLAIEAGDCALRLEAETDLAFEPAAKAPEYAGEIRRLKSALVRACFVRRKTPRYDERYALEVVHQAHRYVCRALEGKLVEVFEAIEYDAPELWARSRELSGEADAAARRHNMGELVRALDGWARILTEDGLDVYRRTERNRKARERCAKKKAAREAEAAEAAA